MLIARTIEELRNTIASRSYKSLGFVPTMGALHEGHLSLIQKAFEQNDLVVVSVFVNPTQFGPNEDFDKYPRNYSRDIEILQTAGVHILFLPEIETMYPLGHEVEIRLPKISSILCGKFRPGHFDGVALILTKFFNILRPNKAYFGQKDYQQTIIVKKLVEQLFWEIEIVVCPTVRDEDGLAKSSRNQYLSAQERKNALILYQTLLWVASQVSVSRDLKFLAEQARQRLISAPSIKLEYFEILRARDLEPIDFLVENAIALGAIYVNNTRLIDNILLTVENLN
ncbi:MAG: pantoate--beta-alanine ligase [Bacteroidia bacterium]|nr:pantoate--beta-alanine ligase [Bacteroidia bacterium]MDW8158303.1 pantoate--beta-alanine ligase [Bacteroidia bacterium]